MALLELAAGIENAGCGDEGRIECGRGGGWVGVGAGRGGVGGLGAGWGGGGWVTSLRRTLLLQEWF